MTEKLVITLIKNPLWGYILQAVVVRQELSGALSIVESAGGRTSLVQQSEEPVKEIIRLIEKLADKSLMKSFSKDKSVADFHKHLTQETIDRYIRPCIDGYHQKILTLLPASGLSLYIRTTTKTRALYDTEKVEVTAVPSQVVFHFKRDKEEGLRYFIRVKYQDEELELMSKSHYVLSDEPALLVVDNKLLVFEDVDSKKLLPFFTKKHITVPAASEKAYIKKFVLACVEKYEVKSEGLSIVETMPSHKVTLALEKDWNNAPALYLRFYYGEKEFPIDSSFRKIVATEEHNGELGLSWFYPDKQWENTIITLLQNNGLEKSGINHFILQKEEGADLFTGMPAMIDWIRTHADLLKQFTFTQNIPSQTYFMGEINVCTAVDAGNDWFDLRSEVVFGTFRIPFTDFREHIIKGIREYELPDGRIAILPQEWFSQYTELMIFGKKSGDTLRFNKSQFRLLELVSESGTLAESFTFNKENILPPPANLQATLRTYQQVGYSWMVYLYENDFGGCLADDMGLGKTIQTISLLLHVADKQKQKQQETTPPSAVSAGIETWKSETEIKQGQLSIFDQPLTSATEPLVVADPVFPSLIVLPTSLIHNWHNELKRFAPSLKVHIHVGSKRIKPTDRLFCLFDVILTTYGTLRNDINLLKSCHFHHLILDESQNIKNATSDAHKAVKKVNALHKLALTGTPVENSLSDLWAMFNIVNEGMLSTHSLFKDRYVNPILSHDKDKEEALLHMIQPFILRRTKEQAAPDLPPLQEELVYCEMEQEQQHYYSEEKSKLRNKLAEMKTHSDSRQVAFLTLQGLTRLRLLANHPVLTDAGYEGGSGKFDQIIMRLETLKSEGHKVLVFSSFVKHLHLLSDYFDKQQWSYAWLTGATAVQDREKEINKFMHQEDVNCFFVSLKAGGVGLNLTVADYVFILDPWWNPAAEMQALSRAHRIGQNKKVIAYRFISTDTIEEKIRRLQESKSQLAQTFVSDSNTLKNMQEEDINALME